MRTRPIALTLLVLFATTEAPARAATPRSVTHEDQRDVMVTIYNGNLGLVKDVREARFPAGTTEVQFTEVAARIDPTTVHLKSLTDPAGLRILEQNYEYDLLTSQKLMEKYVGKKVRLYQGDGTYHEATLLSTNGPIFEINGQIHMGQYGRLVLPALPENLVAQPTLVWLLRNQAPRPQRVEASYLTGGITWKADYVMVLNAADTLSDLTGWVTIDNQSGATYKDAALKLVAGDVNRARDPRREARMLDLAAKAASVAEASRDFQSEGFFEYHLYTLDGRTTIKDNQTKQLALLTSDEVPVTKQLIYYGAQDYYPERLRCAHFEPEGRGLPGAPEQQGTPARRPAAEGEDPRLQGGSVRQPAIHRRGLDRPHPQGRATAHQDGRRLRPRRQPYPEGLEEARLEPLGGRVGDHAPQSQVGGADGDGRRAGSG